MRAAMIALLPAVLSLFFVFSGTYASRAAYIESVAANVDGPSSKTASSSLERRHEPFVPMVAFQCGYRNKYMNKNGDWQDDPSSAASCLQGKYDILKYCKRVYPNEDITNIVEYSHMTHIEKWCKEEGAGCKHQATVRPYRCIVGEFVTESLQVPSQCHFSHVAGKNKCNDYKYWNLKAESECGLKTDENSKQSMKLRSFAILEPCGLGMFRGVEYVCCPKSVEDKIEKVVALQKDNDEDDYDEDDEDDDDESDESSESKLNDAKKEKEEKSEQDAYFKDEAGANEHDRFRDAEERLEKKHRKKVTKVITEWSELFDRYNKMKEKDPKGAEEYKREMTSRFRKTVASLEEENKEQRSQIEEVHDERVQAALNEKKRQATHDYRAALAVHVGSANKANVLHTLKNYIKAEEKDRSHMLNRYRHLLRSDPEQAISFEPILLHRLRYIDLRINGTLAMLRDFPQLEKEIRPVAVEFWNDYRRENTPEVTKDEPSLLGGDEKNERLVRFYKETYEHKHPGAQLAFNEVKETRAKAKASVTTTATTLAPSTSTSSLVHHVVAFKDLLADDKEPEDSDEDQFDDDEEEQEEDGSLSSEEEEKTGKSKPKKVEMKQEMKKKEKSNKDKTKKLNLDVQLKPLDTMKMDVKESGSVKKPASEEAEVLEKPKTRESDSDDEDDDDDEEEENDSQSESESEEQDEPEDKFGKSKADRMLRDRQLSVDIEPIVSAASRLHEELLEESPQAYARRDMLIAENDEYEERKNGSYLTSWTSYSNFIVGFIACVFVVLIVAVVLKRRSRHPGFIEVDVCTPEDRHLTKLQVNGYENPTYDILPH